MVESIVVQTSYPQALLCWSNGYPEQAPNKRQNASMGACCDSMCVFWGSSIEDRDHLFSQCSITKRIWDNIMGLCLVSDAKTYWKELVKWGTTQLKGRVFRTLQCKLAWWATVYQLWEQRNVFYMREDLQKNSSLELLKRMLKGRMRVISSTVIQCTIRVPFCRWEINYALPPFPALKLISVELELTDTMSVYQLRSCLPNMAYVR